MSTEVIIVNGYIRENEHLIKPKIIPSSINLIIFNYYYNHFILFYITSIQTGHGLYAIDINNNTNWKFNVYDLINNLEFVDPGQIGYTSMVYINNICIPQTINTSIKSSKFSNFKYNSNATYSSLIKCGGYSSNYTDECTAILFNKSQLINQSEVIDAVSWNLPKLPVKQYGCYTIYSDEYGLLCIGGARSHLQNNDISIYNLNFNDINDDSWKWKRFTNMETWKIYPSCTFIDDDKLFVAAGMKRGSFGSVNTVELFQLSSKKWSKLKSCKHQRCYSGITYNQHTNMIYLAGGTNTEQIVEFYDIEKDEWFELNKTIFKHGNYPSVWIYDTNLLYVASVRGDGIECLDLRDNTQKWCQERKDLGNVFGTNKSHNFQFHYQWMICG